MRCTVARTPSAPRATAAQSALCGRESTRNIRGALRADLAETTVRGIRVALALGL